MWPSRRATWLTSVCCSGRTSVTPIPLRPARPVRPTRWTYDVLGRRVEVDYLADVLNVEPARRHVRGDERRRATGVEGPQCPLAPALRHVAVHRDGADAVPVEPLDEPVGAALRPDEDERRTLLGLQEPRERLDLVLVRDRDEAVLDLGLLLPDREVRLEPRRVVRVAASERPDDAVERR